MVNSALLEKDAKLLSLNRKFTMKNDGQMSGFCLAQCPGKNMAQGRDGKTYERDVVSDVKAMSQMGITLIICLISDIEIRFIGCNSKKYR